MKSVYKVDTVNEVWKHCIEIQAEVVNQLASRHVWVNIWEEVFDPVYDVVFIQVKEPVANHVQDELEL